MRETEVRNRALIGEEGRGGGCVRTQVERGGETRGRFSGIFGGLGDLLFVVKCDPDISRGERKKFCCCF